MKISALILGWVALGSSACGMSPVLHHANPTRSVDTGRVVSHPTAGMRCDFAFKAQNLCANYVWVKEPTRQDEGSFKLTFFQAGTSTKTEPIAASVFVKLWMPDMGHGSQKVVTLHSKDAQGFDLPGEFDATEVYFVMGGKWEIFVQLKDAAGKIIDSAKVNYEAQ